MSQLGQHVQIFERSGIALNLDAGGDLHCGGTTPLSLHALLAPVGA